MANSELAYLGGICSARTPALRNVLVNVNSHNGWAFPSHLCPLFGFRAAGGKVSEGQLTEQGHHEKRLDCLLAARKKSSDTLEMFAPATWPRHEQKPAAWCPFGQRL